MDLRRLESYAEHSRALNLDGVDWEAMRSQRLPAEALRTLRYMQDIESHTIVYLRSLLATRAIDEPEVGEFLACWVFEEASHGRALQRVLAANDIVVKPRPRSRASMSEHIKDGAMSLLSRSWSDFVAVHMTWGAINELTTLTGYQRLATVAGHPALADLLERIIRDESRHFSFYFHQARRRLVRPRVARVVRLLIERFWAPVGSGVQPDEELRFLGGYLLSGREGRAAAQRVDRRIQTLPGLSNVPLLEDWLERHDLLPSLPEQAVA